MSHLGRSRDLARRLRELAVRIENMADFYEAEARREAWAAMTPEERRTAAQYEHTVPYEARRAGEVAARRRGAADTLPLAGRNRMK